MSETGRSVADVIEAMLPLDFERHESQTIKDAAIRDRRALAVRVAAALAAASPDAEPTCEHGTYLSDLCAWVERRANPDTAAPVDATLTDDEREALSKALRSCRIEDAPIRLIHEGDIFHVTHMVGVAVERILAQRAAVDHAKIEAVRALLPTGPRPFVDLHSIGEWDLAQRLRAALADAPEPTPALWQNASDAIRAGQFPGADGGAE